MAFDPQGLALPGIPGTEFGQPGSLIFIGLNIALDIGEGNLLGFVIDVAKLIADVILILIDAFSGVPQMQKSITVAQRLLHSKNPTGYIWGNSILRMVQGLGIPLSTSDPHGQTLVNSFRHQFVFNMVQQGMTVAAAKHMAGQLEGNTQGANQPLPVELRHYIDPAFKMWGNQKVLDDYQTQIDKHLAKGQDLSKASELAFKWILQHETLKNLTNIIISKEDPNSKPPPPPPPQCGPGTHWDPVAMLCIPDLPPAPPPLPCQPRNDPDQDEIGDLQDCIAANLNALAARINSLGSGGNGGTGNPDPVTCAQLATYVLQITASLDAISSAISSSSSTGAPIDLSQIVTQFAELIATLARDTPILTRIADVLDQRLAEIAAASSSSSTLDLEPIRKVLAVMADQGDVDQKIFDALQEQGMISSADLQVLQGIKWSDAMAYVTSSSPYRTAAHLVKKAGAELEDVANLLSTGPSGVASWATDKIKQGLTLERNVLQSAITPLLEAITSSLKPAGATQLGVIGVDPDRVLADVAAVGLNLYIVTILVGLISHGAAEQLEKTTEVITALLGFEELKEVQIGPLVQEGIARIATFQAKALFRQELPSTSRMQGWVSQGLMNPARSRALSAFNGTPEEIYPISQAAAYRGLNPRQMLRLIETNLFTDQEIADELTFSGLRVVSQHRLLHAAPFLATAGVRSALRGTIERAGVAGLLSDADLLDRVDASETNTDRDQLILSRVHLEQLISEAKDLETEYTTLFKGGIIDDATFRNFLSGIGLQPWKVNTVAAKAEASANATLQRKELAAAAALERATVKAERDTLRKNFIAGTIDEATYAAGLIATGLTPLQVAAWTDLASLQKIGSPRWLFGLSKTPAEATLLRQRVTALTDQRKRLQITDPEFVNSLQALGIPPKFINALRAAADATITPKDSAVVIPVQTS